MKTKSILIVCAFIIGVIIVGCTKEPENNIGLTTGKLKLQLTDAPFPFDLIAEANVTINKIEIRNVDATDENPFITISEAERTFNLLDLTNGVTESLVNIDVPIGTYDLIRLYVSAASVVLTNSIEFDLVVPSGSQTGIKIFIDPAIQVIGGLTTDLLLDFDVSRSFVMQGNHETPAGIKGFHFKPVIRASNLSLSGRVSGIVLDSLDNGAKGVLVSVIEADTILTSTIADSLGAYTVLGLPSGEYDLKYEYDTYEAVTIEEVLIRAGNETTQNVKLTE